MEISKKELKKKLTKEKYRPRSGYLTMFHVGFYNDQVEVVFWEDDGTRDEHLTIFYKGVPVGTVPLIDQRGIRRFLLAILGYYLYTFGEEECKKELMEYLESC